MLLLRKSTAPAAAARQGGDALWSRDSLRVLAMNFKVEINHHLWRTFRQREERQREEAQQRERSRAARPRLNRSHALSLRC